MLAPSLCEGWSRGHVLSHLARNADALVRVCDVALTGTADTMYDDVESRDADIERGARRVGRTTTPPTSATRRPASPSGSRPCAPSTPRSASSAPRAASRSPVGMVPFMRLREVVYHHVDLDAGYTFASAPAEVVALFLRDAANRLAHDDAPPSLHIVDGRGRRARRR